MQSLRTIILTFLIAWRFPSNVPISNSISIELLIYVSHISILLKPLFLHQNTTVRSITHRLLPVISVRNRRPKIGAKVGIIFHETRHWKVLRVYKAPQSRHNRSSCSTATPQQWWAPAQIEIISHCPWFKIFLNSFSLILPIQATTSMIKKIIYMHFKWIYTEVMVK